MTKQNENRDSLDPVVDQNSLKVYQPTRPLGSILSKPGSTSDLVGKLAQLGQGNSTAGSTATRVISSGSGSPGAQGPVGPSGVQGVQGVQGNQGGVGPQGNQGPSGAVGYQISVNGAGVSIDALYLVNGAIASTSPWGTDVNGTGV